MGAVADKKTFRYPRGRDSEGYADLNEALGYALQGGYWIYEADIRVALAWAHRASDNLVAGKTEAQGAVTLSEEMGYYWGKLDAKEVLQELKAV